MAIGNNKEKGLEKGNRKKQEKSKEKKKYLRSQKDYSAIATLSLNI